MKTWGRLGDVSEEEKDVLEVRETATHLWSLTEFPDSWTSRRTEKDVSEVRDVSEEEKDVSEEEKDVSEVRETATHLCETE